MAAAHESRGNHTGYSSDGNRGYPAYTIDDRSGDGVQRKVSEEQVIPVYINGALATTGLPVATARGKAYRIVNVEALHSVPETTAVTLNLKVEVVDDADVSGGGTDVIGATDIDMKAAAVQTVQSGTVITAGDANKVTAGQHILVHAALANATPEPSAEYRGVVLITIVPETLTPVATS